MGPGWAEQAGWPQPDRVINMTLWTKLLLLADEAAPAGKAVPGGQGEAPAPAPDLFVTMMPLIGIGFLFYFLLIRPQGREQKRKQQLLGSLKKNDQVVTIGGIIGTIASVSDESREVTLKVDDNTRIKVLRSSIQGLLNDKEEDGKPAQ